ncbi:exported protein (hyp15) [Plasmodium gaboni]|uniref:Exported protein (Hyp15) n=1 Tax=Plasmodium gaboni TaxID=647221 RepID=A0A151L2U7_9APIC|nr:exported protein (hyp15) [Plasmodium gaboni]KYN93214.1 exported protein (hyp15) [Plasmodium gaboni]
MNFCSFIFFLFIVILSVLHAAKENNHKKDLYEHGNKNSYSSSNKRTTSVKCAIKEPEYHEFSKDDKVHDNFVKYNKGENQNNLDKGKSDKKYSKNKLNNKNSEDISESVKSGEPCDYKNNMMKECNVTSSSKPIMKKTSRMTRFKNKLYKMISERNKFWRVISGIIAVLGQYAIICDIIMFIAAILGSGATTAFIAAGGIYMVIILFIILIIVLVWFLVTWLWSHKDVYYETHEE